MSVTCQGCAFWKGARDEHSGMSECRRYPPTASKPHSYGGTVAVWIKTEGHNWCGEFKRKDEPCDLD